MGRKKGIERKKFKTIQKEKRISFGLRSNHNKK